MKPLYLLISLVSLAVTHCNKQQKQLMDNAIAQYKAGNLDSAKILIDNYIVNWETQSRERAWYFNGYSLTAKKKAKPGDERAWYFRGYLYKDIYTLREKINKESPSRLIALESFQQFLKLAPDTSYLKENVIKNINFLAATLYNDAVMSLNIEEYHVAISNFRKYKEIVKTIDKSKKTTDLEILFNNSLGSIYMQIYEKDREKNKDFFDLSKKSYQSVLKLDSCNYSANYNLGILYFNAGVREIFKESALKQTNLAMSVDFSNPFAIIPGLEELLADPTLSELQKTNAVEFFRTATPFLIAAYKKEKKKEVLIALSGIFFLLKDDALFNKFQSELDLIEKN